MGLTHPGSFISEFIQELPSSSKYKDMYKDLREFIDRVDQIGMLRRINGADPRFEIGGITEVAAGSPDCPALLFDNIAGFPSGFQN